MDEKERNREYQRRYRAKHRERIREKARAWQKANPEKVKEAARRAYHKKRKGSVAKPREPNRNPCTFCGAPKCYAKGLCRCCYARNLKNGSLEYRRNPRETPADKFHRSYKVEGECWVWFGTGKESNCPWLNCKAISTHARQFAYELEHGPQPDHALFVPTCGNQLCVNPAHVALKSATSPEQLEQIIASVPGLSRRDAVRRMRDAGLTLREIGDVLGFTREYARQLLLPKPEKVKQAKMAEEWEQISRLMSEGRTQQEMGQSLGLKPGTILSRIHKMGYRATVSFENGVRRTTYQRVAGQDDSSE